MSAAPVGNLILRTRVQILKANLEKIKGIRDSIERVRGDVRELVALPEASGIEEAIGTIRQALVTSENELKKKPPDRKVIWKSLTSIDQAKDEIEEYLTGAQRLVNSIETRFLSVTQSEVGTALENDLAAKADAQIHTLDTLIEEIDAAGRQRDDEVAWNSRQEAWRQYAGQEVYGESQKLFREYVDLLGGLALRDSGYDEGICRVADKLIRTCATRLPEFGWYSLTIPARQEALETTMARIIRLGFPEWTIWTLPLAAHELGHVVALGRIEPLIENEGKAGHPAAHTQICFADAFATFVMGPAYVCAAILMRLDPFRAITPGDNRLTLKRAECVLHMLKRMNEAAGRLNPYGGIGERLRTEWQDALSQAAGAVPEGAPEDPEDSELTEEEAAHVDRVAEFITTTFGRRGFPASWEMITDWAKSLAEDDGASIQPSPVDVDLRYVPNAAWLVRLGIDDYEDLDGAAEAALELWHRLEKLLSEEIETDWGPLDTGTRATRTTRAGKPVASDSGQTDGQGL